VFDASGQLLKDAATVPPGEEIVARLMRGRLHARATGSEPADS